MWLANEWCDTLFLSIHCKLEKVKLKKFFFFLLLWFHPEDTGQITDAEFLFISEKAETDWDFFVCSNILLM